MELLNPLISEYTWANKPSVAPLGQIICVTDVAENGALFRGNGTRWVRMHTVKYYDLGASVTITGTTAETTLATLTVKGGLMGLNGVLRIWPLWSFPNSANNKTLRTYIGGALVHSTARTTEVHLQSIQIIRNINSVSSQKMSGITTGIGSSTSVINAAAINTDNDFILLLTGQLGNSGESLILEGLFVEIV